VTGNIPVIAVSGPGSLGHEPEGTHIMGIGAGIFLAAIGAILTFAVSVTASGFNIHTIGVILMIVGVAGILLDLVLFMPRRRQTTVVTDSRVAEPTVTRTY
jgi:hypothetical protein